MRKWKRQFGIVAALTLSAALLAGGCGSSAEPNEAAAVDSSDTAQVEAPATDTGANDAASGQSETDMNAAEDKQNENTEVQEAETGDVKKEEGETQTSSDSLFSEVSSEGFSAEDAIKGKKSSLPAYEYPGPEQFYYELYKYIIDNFGKQYLPGDVCIPCPIIVAEDDSNKDDMLLYGNFEVYNYTLSGDTLMTVSGGSHPGCIHYKMGDNGYEITGFDQVADGSDYDSTAKEIFGDKYDAFIKAS